MNLKKITLSVFVLGFLAFADIASAQMGMIGGWNMMGNYRGFTWFGRITLILVWSLLILGIVALVKWLKKK